MEYIDMAVLSAALGGLVALIIGIKTRDRSPRPMRAGKTEHGYLISSTELSRDQLFDAIFQYAERIKDAPENSYAEAVIKRGKDGTTERVVVSYYRERHIGKGKLWLVKG